MSTPFAHALRLARMARALTMASLAATSSVSLATIGSYESGRKLPSSATLMKLSAALGVSLDFLMPADECVSVEECLRDRVDMIEEDILDRRREALADANRRWA